MAQEARPDEALSWGGPQDMSAWEALMWRAEHDPRTSSTGILLEILEGEPEWTRFVAAHRRTVARFPRLRERVVEPPLPVVQPAWSAVPDFDVADHLHMVRLPRSSTADRDDRPLLEFCESAMERPLDPGRPPWEGILVTGLPHGRAAYLFRFHHSLTDGLGLIQLLALAHTGSPLPEGEADAPVVRAVVTPGSLVYSRLADRLRGAPDEVVARLRHGLAVVSQAATRPAETVRGGAQFFASLHKMLSGPATKGSPLLRPRTVGNRFLMLDVDLTELRAAAKSVEGSVNDAFVAAVLGGLRRYHEHHGVMVDHIPLAMPVSLRQENDPLGGNRFAGVRIPAPLAETDPAERIRIVHEHVLEAREEPAIGFLDYLSPALTKLPTSAIIELSASLTSASDVQVSNIRGIGHPVYLAGQKVLRTYPLGPRPGVAAMVTMITYDGTCCLGLNLDPGLFPHLGLIKRCIQDGFDEVLQLGSDG